MSADAALFKAVRLALLANAEISALIGGQVKSDWGGELKPPYIRLSIPRSLPWEDDCGEGSEISLRVHVFTRADGPVQCSEIAGHVRKILHGAALDIEGHDLRESKYERTDYLGDTDPTLRMGIVNFTVIATETVN